MADESDTSRSSSLHKADKPTRIKALQLLIELVAWLAGTIAIAGFLAPYVHQDAVSVLVFLLVLFLFGLILYFVFTSETVIRLGVWKVAFAIFVASAILAAIAFLVMGDIAVRPVDVAITLPIDGKDVTMNDWVQGTVSDPDSKIYVLVHPLSVPLLYVQPSPLVGGDGHWRTNVGFGVDPNVDEKFEVIAIATHENSLVMWLTDNLLRPGQILEVTELPGNTNRSKVITVTRPKPSP